MAKFKPSKPSTKLLLDSLLDELTLEDSGKYFTNIELSPLQKEKCEAVRGAGAEFAKAIIEHVPPGLDKVAIVRKIREAVYLANSSIAHEER
jgi:hypothetical protein